MTRRLAAAGLAAFALATAPAQAAPRWTALTVNDTANSVTPVVTDSDRSSGAVPVGALPLGVAIAPDARRAYVVNVGATPGSGSVSVIDLTADPPAVRANVPVPGGTPNFIAIAPDGAKAYVSNPGNGTIVPLDLTRDPPAAGTPFSAGGGPEGVAFTPDGRKAYAADLTGNAVIPIDVATDSPRAPITLPSRGPFAISVTPDGRSAYVANLNGSSVTPIDVTTDTAGPDIPVGPQPQGIAVAPDGTTVYVGSGGSGTLTPIQVATNTPGQPIPVGNDPYGIAITPDGRKAYVTNGGTGDRTVVPVDLSRTPATPGTPIQVGTAPRGIAITPDQPAQASYAIASAPSGAGTVFDASSSSARFGTIAAYRWSFGDGSPDVTTTTAQTSHVYMAVGNYTTTVTETTEGGTSTAELFTGQTASRAGGPSAASRRVAVITRTRSPVAGIRVSAEPVSGSVVVRLPGATRFAPLGGGRQLRIGTVVDARHGAVRITATSDGRVYAGVFSEGIFRIAQRKRRGATADMQLFGGSFRDCPRSVHEAANKKRSVRHLWGDGSGRFRTVGRFSAAAVRGTNWLTNDLCGATLTKVVSGSVAVRDFVRHRTVVVRAGKQYLARAPG
jgi:YVTN family beta-propeller protein